MGYSPCGHKESDMNEQLSTRKDAQSTLHIQGCQTRRHGRLTIFLDMLGSEVC